MVPSQRLFVASSESWMTNSWVGGQLFSLVSINQSLRLFLLDWQMFFLSINVDVRFADVSCCVWASKLMRKSFWEGHEVLFICHWNILKSIWGPWININDCSQLMFWIFRSFSPSCLKFGLEEPIFRSGRKACWFLAINCLWVSNRQRHIWLAFGVGPLWATSKIFLFTSLNYTTKLMTALYNMTDNWIKRSRVSEHWLCFGTILFLDDASECEAFCFFGTVTGVRITYLQRSDLVSCTMSKCAWHSVTFLPLLIAFRDSYKTPWDVRVVIDSRPLLMQQ